MSVAWIGFLAAGFVLTGMIAQMFPDGRFPLKTIALVILLSSLGAALGNRFLSESTLFTGALVGAALTSTLFFTLFHRTGLLAQEPWPDEPREPPPDP